MTSGPHLGRRINSTSTPVRFTRITTAIASRAAGFLASYSSCPHGVLPATDRSTARFGPARTERCEQRFARRKLSSDQRGFFFSHHTAHSKTDGGRSGKDDFDWVLHSRCSAP